MPDTPVARGRLTPSPTLYASRGRGGWVVHEAKSGASLPLSPLLEACLAAFDGGQSRTVALRALSAWPRPAVSSLIRLLADLGVLVPVPTRRDAWSTWHGVAQWYHYATRDVPVRPQTPPRPAPPAPVVRRRALASVELPLPALDGALREALAERRTWRRLAESPLSPEHVGTLLGATFGIQGWAAAPGAGWSVLKTSPSGGARHSLEAYVCVRRVTGVPAGLYHYRPDRHRLDLLRPGCTARDLGRFLPGQEGYRRASLVVVMSSVLARVTWRYSHARAYRVILVESGHLAQTFALVATALGLASFSTGALADSIIEEAFSLSAASSPIVYAVGAAHRPSGVSWAPYTHAASPKRRATRLGLHMMDDRDGG